MGCDIHLFTEFKRDGAWHSSDIWTTDAEEGNHVPFRFRCWDERNYNVYAFLAGVRNHTWGETIPVLTPPKGLPEDASAEVKEAAANESRHHHSWLTCNELKEGYLKVKDTSISFDAYISTYDPQIAAWLALPELTRGAPPCYSARGGDTRVAWSQPLSELIGPSIVRIINFLQYLSWDEHADDTRIVFWFDN